MFPFSQVESFARIELFDEFWMILSLVVAPEVEVHELHGLDGGTVVSRNVHAPKILLYASISLYSTFGISSSFSLRCFRIIFLYAPV